MADETKLLIDGEPQIAIMFNYGHLFSAAPPDRIGGFHWVRDTLDMMSTTLTLSVLDGSISLRFEPYLFANQYARLLDIVARCPTLEELQIAVSAFAEVENLQLSMDEVHATL